MRLSCQQEDLQRALGYVSRAVSRKSTLPVLGNVLLSAEGGRLKLAATNLEIAITAWADATVEEEGTITVRSDLLTEFVASLPNDSVSIELDRRTLSVAVSCARSKAHIKGIGAEDFPTLASIGDTEPTARIDPAEFREAIGQVAFAAATDDSRPVLAGVLAEFEGASLTLAAADGFRLSVRRCDLVEPSRESLSIVVPARALQELARIIGDLEEPIDLAVTPNRSQLLVRAGSIEFLSRLIDGHFPDVRHIIPQTYGTRMVVSRDEFLAAARRAKLFAQSNNDVVRIQMNPGDGELDPGFATISAQAAETGDNEDHLEAQVEGPQAHIAFNGRYLTEVLSVMRSNEVALEMTSPNAAGVFKPVGSDDFTHVIMPMVIGT
ncbi:DNA polymerase III subunit beta [Sphaerobacter thermophilus]|uniref:Beta sliding clamp n=1 Tax=Sphaerobacter thermophilus (strain ATCC 49802 / DSM 20745 / KCCM 41009 / NCIMB 13125 / S 6022) TaxID=479434 RepID=D1C3D0_SPHTD|nr:DNA polymerase III subunit beta [Sphaerobacter thermophilus]ACZ38747.1 DNA polymerase III, beta subunit [Sphaerobacter thermophilus DSM 20745]